MNPKLTAVAIALGIGLVCAAFADTISVTKICPAGGTCMASGKPSALSFFRTTTPEFNWEALYSGTSIQARTFWVSQLAANVATIELTTNAGDTHGTATLSPRVYYISIQSVAMEPGDYSLSGPGIYGDFHVTTIDGVNCDFQEAREFVMLQQHAAYQVRTCIAPVATNRALPANPFTGRSNCVGVNAAAAVRLGNHPIAYQPNINGQPDPNGLQLRVDRQLVTYRVDGRTLGTAKVAAKRIYPDSNSCIFCSPECHTS